MNEYKYIIKDNTYKKDVAWCFTKEAAKNIIKELIEIDQSLKYPKIEYIIVKA